MLKKLISLNRSDFWAIFGVVGGVFLMCSVVIAAALLLGSELTVPLASGVALPIAAGFLALACSLGLIHSTFMPALRFGQTRRRSLGLTAALTILESGSAMALAALLAWVERTLLPALWLALSGADRLVWGGRAPVPEPSLIAGDPEWQARLEEMASTLYVSDFTLDWWWYPLLLAIGLAAGLIIGAVLQRFGSRGGWALWVVWMVICLGPQLFGENVLFLDRWVQFGQWAPVAGGVFALLAAAWSLWSLLHAVVKS